MCNVCNVCTRQMAVRSAATRHMSWILDALRISTIFLTRKTTNTLTINYTFLLDIFESIVININLFVHCHYLIFQFQGLGLTNKGFAPLCGVDVTKFLHEMEGTTNHCHTGLVAHKQIIWREQQTIVTQF